MIGFKAQGTALVIAAVVGAMIATPARAEAWDMVVINATGKPIRTIELGPSPATGWTAVQSDPLGVLGNGERATIHFNKSNGICRMDLRATFSDATAAVYASINVCDNTYVTLKLTNGKPTFSTN